jgi:anti-sigma-K factor RskA
VSDRDDLHLLAGAYALGALNNSEREDFEEYLLTSEEARAEVASLSDTAVMLGLATEPITPPPALKASLMAQIAATPQLSAAGEEAERSNVTALFGTNPVRSASSSKVQRRWYARPATFLIAAAAVIAIFVGGNVVNLVSSNTQQSQQASSVTEISSASDSQHASSSVEGGGKATLIWSNKLQKSVVVFDKLSALPADKTYQVWYVAGSETKSAGTFSAADSGKTVKVLTGKMTDGDTVGITVEPAGGSKQPTTTPVAAIPTA